MNPAQNLKQLLKELDSENKNLGNEFIIGSGEHALLFRYHAGPSHLDKVDQMTLEWAGCYSR